MVVARNLNRQSSFGSGEFSPRTLGRTDLPQYASGMSQMSNWVVNPQGSATRRPGFKLEQTAKTQAIVTFTEQTNPKNFALNDVCWTGSQFVAVGGADGTDAYIATSTDGVTWTERTNPKNFALNAVCWTGSLLVAVGNADGTDAYIITSTDGITWTERTNPKNFALYDVIWTGSILVAVGAADGTDAYIVTSSNGTSWAEKSNPKNFALNGVVWNGSLLAAVGAADGTDAYIATSPDGTTWTEQTNVKNVQLNAICWTGTLLVAVGDDTGATGPYITTSADGETWAERRVDNPLGFNLYDILWTGSVLLAVGEATGTAAFLLTSYDGINWPTEITNPKNFDLNGICWNGSLLVAVGAPDGTNSYMVTSPGDTALRRLETFVGSTGSPYLMELGQTYLRFIRDGAYIGTSPGTTYEITTPWNSQDVADLQFTQANDVMFVSHPNYPVYRLTRTSENVFSLINMMDYTTPTTNRNSSTYKFWDGPYLDENNTVTTLSLNTTGTGSKTLTASSSLFASTDVGRLVRIKGASVWGWGIITAYSTATSVTIYMVEDPNIATAVTRWSLGAWSATTGYPKAVTFFQQRLVFANTKAEPMRVWASVIAAFDEFKPTELDDTALADNAVFFTIASRRMLPIQWLEAGKELYAGTRGGVFRIDASEGYNEITPRNLRIRQASSFGADNTLPVAVGDVVLYVQQGGRIVRALTPTSDAGTLDQPDLTLISEHMGATGVKQMVFGSVPHSVVWARRADGLLIGLSFNPLTRILGWHSHQLPGSLTGFDYPKVLSMTILPVDGHDQLWVVVRRTVNNAYIETIESMALPFDSTIDNQVDALYLDSATYYNGVSTTSITGLSHLEGESVYAYADGMTQGPFTVASGAITLTTAATVVWTGFDYSALSDFETLPVKASKDAVNAKVRIISTMVEFLDTNGFKIGLDAAGLEEISPSLQPDTWTTGTIKPLVTGDREHIIPGQTETRATVLMRPNGPLPATVTGLAHVIEFDHV